MQSLGSTSTTQPPDASQLSNRVKAQYCRIKCAGRRYYRGFASLTGACVSLCCCWSLAAEVVRTGGTGSGGSRSSVLRGLPNLTGGWADTVRSPSTLGKTMSQPAR